MFTKKLNLQTINLLAATLFSGHAAAIQIEFDYRFDTSGFFTDLTTGTALLEQRQIVDKAASFYSGFSDQLAPIIPGGNDTWSVSIAHPGQLGATVVLENEPVAANTLKIFIGGSRSLSSVLGFAGTGFNQSAQGSADFVNDVNTRGQRDYGVWGGSIWLNSNHDWYVGEELNNGLTAGQPDLLTTVTHEIGHILGFGEADNWFSQIDNGFFTGAHSVASYGGPVPLDRFSSHWAEGVSSTLDGVLQETMMDPSTPYGTRQLPTDLDYAGFADIGWELAPVPVPAALWLFATGLAGFIVLPRQRKLAE